MTRKISASPIMILHRLLLPWLIAAPIGLSPLPAFGQAAGAQGENFLYRVQSGDTLIGLAGRYTQKPANWAALQTLNNVQDPAQLPIGHTVKIPFALIPETPADASITHLAGQATLNGQPLGAATQVAEGNTLVTGPGGFVTLKLNDGSVLTMPSSSRLTMTRLRAFKGTGLTDSIIHVGEGSLESSVAPKETGVGRFEVRTPLSITGVRGTRLRVHVSAQGAQSEVIKGQAHINSALQAADATLRANQGTAVNTQGKILGVRALLPAPDLPAPSRSPAGGWGMAFAPIPGAASYLVRVSTDDAGTNLISRQQFPAPRVTFNASGPGNYYVAVRAIDTDGIEGNDATQTFLGVPVLNTSGGMAVLSGFGEPIQLTDY
jgi:hypothetical protein